MLFTTKTTLRWSAIACGLMAANICLPLSAQTPSENLENISFEDIEAGKDGNWSFSSEDETVSIEDNLQELELEEYDISTPYDSELRLTEEERRWGNRGDRPDYTLETEVYNY